MKTFSITQGTNYVVIAGVLVLVARHFGITLVEGEVITTLTVLATLIAPIVSWVDRYRKNDVTVVGFRK